MRPGGVVDILEACGAFDPGSSPGRGVPLFHEIYPHISILGFFKKITDLSDLNPQSYSRIDNHKKRSGLPDAGLSTTADPAGITHENIRIFRVLFLVPTDNNEVFSDGYTI